jgi:hypothetical protein
MMTVHMPIPAVHERSAHVTRLSIASPTTTTHAYEAMC